MSRHPAYESLPGLLKDTVGTRPSYVCGHRYGAMSLTDFRNPDIVPGAEDTLRHVLKSGVTVINTAGFYGQGENEKVIGEAHRLH